MPRLLVLIRFHVVLMGVCPSGSADIIFNPGINHLLQADDECYYISETKESNKDFQVIQPTCVQSGLLRTSATLGLLAMYLSGLDPAQIFNQAQDYDGEGGGDVKKVLSRVISHDKVGRKYSDEGTSLISANNNPVAGINNESVDVPFAGLTKGNENVGINEGACPEEEELDEQLAVEVTNWQHDIQLGLQLLKYHGQGEQPTQKPCVKLSVKNPPDQHHSPRLLSLATPPPIDSHSHHQLGGIPEDGPEVVVVGNREYTSHSPPPPKFDKHHRVHSQPSGLFHLGFPKRNHSEMHLSPMEGGHHHYHHGRKSSTMKLHPPLLHHDSGKWEGLTNMNNN